MADDAKIGTGWQDDELDAIVADYFTMLEAEPKIVSDNGEITFPTISARASPRRTRDVAARARLPDSDPMSHILRIPPNRLRTQVEPLTLPSRPPAPMLPLCRVGRIATSRNSRHIALAKGVLQSTPPAGSLKISRTPPASGRPESA